MEGWHCFLGNSKITGDPRLPLLDHIGQQHAWQFLLSHKRMSSEAFDDTDWEAVGQGLRSSTLAFRLWAAKHVSRFCGTGRMMALMGEWDTDCCPCCHLEWEDTFHLPLCPHPDMVTKFDSELAQLQAKLEDLDTSPILLNAITSYVRPRGDRPFSAGLPNPQDTDLAWQDAHTWHHFMEGKFSKVLGDYQAEYYRSISSRRSASRWTSRLSKYLLMFLHNMWKCRNTFVHPIVDGGLSPEAYAVLQEDINTQLHLGTTRLPRNDHYLFKETLTSLNENSIA